jgi:hypothetical protein
VGPPGASSRYTIAGQFNSTASFSALLPNAATAGGGLPAIACYISSDQRTWLAVAQTPPSESATTFCGLTNIGTTGASITILNGIPGWYYYLVASY